MKINQKLYQWVTKNNHNLLLVALVTFCFPKSFLRSIYLTNSSKQKWNGNKTCFTLSFDCDYPEDVIAIPDILKTLKNHSFKASFACVGYWIKQFPDIHKQILDAGHEIINHTYSHPDNEILNPGTKYRELSYAGRKAELEQCHEICMKILNHEPLGSRIPHFKHNFDNDIYQISKDLNYSFSSSTWVTNTVSAGLPFLSKEGIIEFPLSTCPKHPFSVFDTWHSLNTPRWSHKIVHRGETDYFDLFKVLINLGIETNSYLNIYMDPADILKLSNFKKMLSILENSEIDVVTYEEYIDKYPAIKF